MKYDKILDEFIAAYPEVEDNRRYVLYSPPEDPEYKILLFRTVNEVHAYWSGYGHMAIKKKLEEFDSPQEIMEWAMSKGHEMEITPLSAIDRIFMGLDDEDFDEE
jgi:hypothetical protein